MYHGLFEAEESNLSVCEWVSKMAERLELVRDSAALGIAKGREARMKYLNRGTKLREFAKGERE